MKTNFKKTLAVLLAVLMLTSVFSVTAFAAYTAKIQAGSAEGSTLKDGITDDMLVLTTNASNKLTLPDEAYFERENYIQDGWTKTASGGGTLLGFGSTQTVKNNTTKFYPHWKQAVFTFSFEAGNNYDETNPNNYTDASMAELKSETIKTDGTDAQPVVLPGAMFYRDGYVQTGWSTSKSNNGTGTKFDLGSVYNKSITKDVTLYPFWSPLVYDVSFVGGEFGVGTAQNFEISHNKTTRAPGEIFTREDYTQIGWSTIENSDVVELEFNAYTPKILGDTVYYPVWRANIYASSVSSDSVSFGTICVEYQTNASKEFTITNEGNVDLSYTLPVSENYDITLVDGDLTLAPGRSFTVKVEYKMDLTAGNYAEDFVIVASKEAANVTLKAALKVVEHSFGKHKSNGDSTYTKDGTKSADCLNGCGKKDTIADPGSVKVYSADNNDAAGLASSYIHHRTVRFTAYGSGMDAAAEDNLNKRFRPVSWYVDDEFNGEFTGNKFENGYDVTFTHTIFGKYTLIINYVEEEFDATTGEWVATDVTDTKTFEYSVGTTAEEEQEIVMPNTILSIIFGLFAELLKLLGIGG